jgi:hypothetical protein
MPRLYRWAWRACPPIIMLASYFGVPLPKSWGVTLDWVRFIDLWIIQHAAYPSLFALSVGLLLGTVIVPDVWRHIQQSIAAPLPDMPISAAIDYIVNDSRASLKRSKPPEMEEYGPAKGQVIQERGVEHRDALNKLHERLISGDIIAWGRQEIMPPTMLPTFSQPIRQIAKDYWDAAFLDPLHCFGLTDGVAQTAFANYQPQPGPRYTTLQLNRSQVRRVWRPKRLFKRVSGRLRRAPRLTYWSKT